MDLVVANIKSVPLMRSSRVEHDIKKMATLGNIFLPSEIAPAYYKRILAKVMKAHGYSVHCLSTETPIALDPKEWIVIDSEIRTMHGSAKASGLRGFHNPTRKISCVKITRRSSGGKGAKFAILNTHTVPKAFSGGRVTFRTWRQSRWTTHFIKQQAWIEELYAAGYNVVWGGDMNRSDYGSLKYHKNQILVVHHGLDWMWALAQPGYQFKVTGRQAITAGTFTDHAMISGRLHFSKKPAQ
jgi:hypothetical protein